MYYEINVSLNGTHFFATAKRSITSERELKKALPVFIKKFTKAEGFNITVVKQHESGTILNINDILKS